MNIAMLLDMAADALGDRCALVTGGRRMSFAQLRDAAQAAAKRLVASDADYAAFIDVNGPALPGLLFGAALAGKPFVPLNYRLSRPEIQALLARVNPALVVVGERYQPLVGDAQGLTPMSSAELMKDASEGESIDGADVDPSDVAIQLFTSGTTGQPKAALLRHEHLVSYILGTVEFAAAGEDEATLISVPPYHIAGISAVLSSTYAGRRMVQLEGFEADAWLAACEAEQVTQAFLVPTMLSRVVDELEARGRRGPASLRAIAYGGGKMPLTTVRRAMELMPDVNFTNAYGLTETSSTVAVLTPDDHREALGSADPQVAARLTSVGQPTGAVEIEVRDDAGQVLPPNAAGTLFVRGAQVAGEYREQGSLLDGEGWFCTRDVGYLDSSGYLFLDGRADDVIVRGGENISPGEIEDVLIAQAGVQEAAVVAIPDGQWGEGVAAVVVPVPGAALDVAELQARVRDALRSSRVPSLIVFREQLPYNELGKLLRRQLRDELVAGEGA